MKLGILKRSNRDERGLTLLEYAAGAAFVLAIAIAAFSVLGGSISGYFSGVGNRLTTLNPDTSIN